jgi:hypothetical protein
MAILGPVVHPRRRFHEDMLDADKRRYLGFRGWIAAQLVGDDLARAIWISGQQALEEAFRGRGITAFLQQDIELCPMLIDSTP